MYMFNILIVIITSFPRALLTLIYTSASCATEAHRTECEIHTRSHRD